MIPIDTEMRIIPQESVYINFYFQPYVALYLLVHYSVENDKKDVSNFTLKLCDDLDFLFFILFRV